MNCSHLIVQIQIISHPDGLALPRHPAGCTIHCFKVLAIESGRTLISAGQ